MNGKYLKAAIITLIGCALISVATSFFTYQYRSHQSRGIIGELSYYNGSNTFITPNDVFEPYYSLDVQSGKQSSGTSLNYGALFKNIILIYVPLLVSVVLILRSLDSNPGNIKEVTSATISGAIFFIIGAALTYSFYITPLKQQQAYANSLYSQNQKHIQQLRSK